MAVYTMQTKPRASRLRPGDMITQPAPRRTGPKTTRVQVSTPCCGVEYRIDLAEVDQLIERGHAAYQECGKNRNARGNRHDASGAALGCRCPYRLAFTRRDGGYTAVWTVQ